jgi:hypothetical protein
MAKYLFVYHGGESPEGEEAVKELMDDWGAWFGTLGTAVIDGGNPVGPSITVQPDGSIADNGGANPASGYSLIEAADIDDAIEKARGCPILTSRGSIEVAEAFDM